MPRETLISLRLERDTARREAAIYTELSRALILGEEPMPWLTGDGRFLIYTIALGRKHGGLACVVFADSPRFSRRARHKNAQTVGGAVWTYFDDFRAKTQHDPYHRDACNKIAQAREQLHLKGI